MRAEEGEAGNEARPLLQLCNSLQVHWLLDMQPITTGSVHPHGAGKHDLMLFGTLVFSQSTLQTHYNINLFGADKVLDCKNAHTTAHRLIPSYWMDRNLLFTYV